MTNGLLVSNENGIVTLSLNRPKKCNALDGNLIAQLLQTIQIAANQSVTRLLILRGIGNHFCAGADINWMKKISTSSPTDNLNDANLLASLMYQLYIFPKPTIVIAHGLTLGGGLGLLAAADIALATCNANFGLSEIKIGLTPAVISPYIISAIGERAALYYFLTGKQFNSQEAHRLGLIHQIIENDPYSAGIDLAKILTTYSPAALLAAKQLVRQVAKKAITTELAAITADHLANLRTSPEAQEGLQAFLEKRTPKWR